MRKIVAIVAFLLFNLSIWAIDASMFTWRSHLSFGDMTSVVDAGDKVYGMAGGSLCSVDKQTEEIQTYSKQDGMNGADVVQIGYDEDNRTLVVAYSDGLIDFYKNGLFTAMADLQRKDLSSSKAVNSIYVEDGFAYLSMPFGVMVLDVQKRLIKDTYYIGDKGADVNVLAVALSADSIYAISSSVLYSIGREDNKMDYANWQRTQPLPADSTYSDIQVWRDELFVMTNHHFFQRQEGQWVSEHPDWWFSKMTLSDNHLFLITAAGGIYFLTDTYTISSVPSPYMALDICISGTNYWLGTSEGIVRQTGSETQLFKIDGPIVNIPYRLKIANQRLYVVPGERWATETCRAANIMIYDILQDTWTNISEVQIRQQTAGEYIFDLMNVAVDPADADHFFVTSYGAGMLECKGDKIIRHYTINNSPLESAAPGIREKQYVRTDGAMFDEQGNLWLLNVGMEDMVHIATPQQVATMHSQKTVQWYKMPLKSAQGDVLMVHTPQEMFVDNRNSHWKWIPYARYTPGIVLLDDNGTPFNPQDDYALLRDAFQDQDGNVIRPEAVYAVAQDKDGALWLAFEKGVITIPASVDFKTSNYCERIKIPRNDGTNLADYLLETEQIRAIAIDGAGRKWFGTASSGLYLISADGQETIEHFTTENSPLLSDAVISLAIDPTTGKVFIGTGNGLMSYQSDAAYPFEDYSSTYAYPNPVRPDYTGPITITGLMDESVVHIVDNAGNLVCETRSNGGLAIWDGKTADGKRAASGVYSVFCNESANNQHAVVKILVMH